MALQNGKLQLIGRWRAGPLGINLSKTGVSASIKNRAGTFNFLKPQYSSFKFAGIQLRGKRAAQLQAIYMLIMAAVLLLFLMVRVSIYLFWLVALPIFFFWVLLVGFVQGVRDA